MIRVIEYIKQGRGDRRRKTRRMKMEIERVFSSVKIPVGNFLPFKFTGFRWLCYMRMAVPNDVQGNSFTK